MLYIQPFLQLCTGGLLVLIERMGINVQRGGGLAVAEDARHRGNIRAARDHQTGGGVPEGMDVQLLRQAVFLEDQLEAIGEGGGRHGELRSLTAEQEVIGGQLPLVVAFGDVCTFLPVLPQETFHLGGEVHIAVTCAGLGFFDEDLLVRHLDRVAADVDGTLLPINVAPLQSAALTPPHPRGDDELEVGLVLNALALQRGDDLLRRFLVRNLLFALAPGVAVGVQTLRWKLSASADCFRCEVRWDSCIGSAREALPCTERSDAKQPGHSGVRAVCLAERTYRACPLYRSAPFVPKGSLWVLVVCYKN